MRRITILWVLLLVLVPAVQAQTGGQFCLRAYEDRNGSTTLDAGEPALTRGVGANLLNADNLVIATALMDDSPNAAQGVICFQFLEAGQYSLLVTSADYQPTTLNTFTASISEGALPTVVEYGATRISMEPTPAASTSTTAPDDQRDTLGRIVLAAFGALVVMASMAVFGVLIYLVAFRRQPVPLQVPRDASKTPTGSIPAVDLSDTSEIKPVE